MKLNYLVIFVISFVTVTVCEHLIVGDVNGKKIIHHSVEQYNAIMFKKRVKNFFYSDPNQRIISGIVAYDNLHSNASAKITAGGVGSTFVNIRMKSETWKGLDYDIGIYS